jgi:hypothetical protein
MKTPADKIAPGANPRNDIIQIIVTNRCDLFTCSNCTQLLPFRADVRFMSVDVFRRALRSLDTWPGVRALFGGNPCSHPNFEELCSIMEEEVPNQAQRGLWTNNLLGKGAVAKRTFWPHGRFNLNVHEVSAAADYMREWLPGVPVLGENKASWHSPILMKWSDYGLSYEQWVSQRETCDINQRWSAAIAERRGEAYGYFCEVGAALDGIRGENHGVLAVPGWWKFGMGMFHEQVRQCCDRGCGVPLRRKGSLDRADNYDVSPSWPTEVPMLSNPAVSVKVHAEFPEGTEMATDYQEKWTAK